MVEEVNKAGGVLGRSIVLVSEDDQTNPEAAVRAARKLIDVDKVSAIMGTWASAVTTAVAPLCWESKTFLAPCRAPTSITLLPHQGFLIRTQPNTKLQVSGLGEFILSLGAKKVFTDDAADAVHPVAVRHPATRSCPRAAARIGSLIYDDKKTTYPHRGRPGAARQPRRHPGQRLHARHDRAAEGPLSARASRARSSASPTR